MLNPIQYKIISGLEISFILNKRRMRIPGTNDKYRNEIICRIIGISNPRIWIPTKPQTANCTDNISIRKDFVLKYKTLKELDL